MCLIGFAAVIINIMPLRHFSYSFFSLLFNRLNREISGGAWCPSKQLSAAYSGNEWIQVDLAGQFVITAVATQGRFGNGMGVEFAEEYWIEYSRDNGSTWNKWTDMSGDYVSHFDFDCSRARIQFSSCRCWARATNWHPQSVGQVVVPSRPN